MSAEVPRSIAQQAKPWGRAALLDATVDCVMRDRNAAYGNPEDNFRNIAEFWNLYLKQAGIELTRPLQPHDIAFMMILMKMARLAPNPLHRDSLVDIAGYAACGADCQVANIPQSLNK